MMPRNELRDQLLLALAPVVAKTVLEEDSKLDDTGLIDRIVTLTKGVAQQLSKDPHEKEIQR